MTGCVHIAGQAMITSLGEGVEANFEALREGKSGVHPCSDSRVTRSSVMAGIIPERIYTELYGKYAAAPELTRAELLSVACIGRIIKDLQDAGIDIDSCRNALVLASAKGNISTLEGRCRDGAFTPEDNDPVLFRPMASRIAGWFRERGKFCDISDSDIYVISNACISGLSAVICARRLILSGRYGNVFVVGVDVQNRFITSGFASFKSLSQELCRPYDAARCGLNLGEACGSVLLTGNAATALKMSAVYGEVVSICGGAASDDANHISGPSRTGDGLHFAMRDALEEAGLSAGQIDMLQMHGTATAYNDEMEAKAAALTGLQNVPVQSLKPYFGHTMGASGVVETLIAAEELRRGIFIGTKGYSSHGVSVPLSVPSGTLRLENARNCLKTASGFGGTNAAVVLGKGSAGCHSPQYVESPVTVRTSAVSDGKVMVDGKPVHEDACLFHDFIRSAYRASGDTAPKFYKMDDLCKTAYVACSWLLSGISFAGEECAVILSGRYGCLDTDMRHQHTIDTEGDEAASPATFVYTLPNVAAAEISIRHHLNGENIWFCSEDEEMTDIRDYAGIMMAASRLKCCIIGHLDFINGKYFAKFELLCADAGNAGRMENRWKP